MCIPFSFYISVVEQKVAFSSVQSVSHVLLFVTPWTAACLASLSITSSWSSLKLMSIELMMPSNHQVVAYTFQIFFIVSVNNGSIKKIMEVLKIKIVNTSQLFLIRTSEGFRLLKTDLKIIQYNDNAGFCVRLYFSPLTN